MGIYVPSFVTREDLCKVFPVATMHYRSSCHNEKVASLSKPKSSRHSTSKPSPAQPKFRKYICVRSKNIVWHAVRPILITKNWFSVLSVDDEGSLCFYNFLQSDSFLYLVSLLLPQCLRFSLVSILS